MPSNSRISPLYEYRETAHAKRQLDSLAWRNASLTAISSPAHAGAEWSRAEVRERLPQAVETAPE